MLLQLGRAVFRVSAQAAPTLFGPTFSWPSLVAYTGEVMRKETNGYWKLNELPGGIYEPYVHPAGGVFSDYMNPFLEPYKAIAERKRGGLCLAAVVSAQLPGRGNALKFV